MPDENRDQDPIEIIVKYIDNRDGFKVIMMHLPYVFNAIFLTIYMLHSVSYLDDNEWYG